jgi:hypothetical protein
VNSAQLFSGSFMEFFTVQFSMHSADKIFKMRFFQASSQKCKFFSVFCHVDVRIHRVRLHRFMRAQFALQ